MTETAPTYRCLRVALDGLLMAVAVCLFATYAHGQAQCKPKAIAAKECYVKLEISGNKVKVTPSDVGLYSGTKLSWQYKPVSTAKPNFDVDFDVDCTPFVDRHFDQATPKTTHGADSLSPYQFERCEYRVTIDGLKVDPHVIVVGGSKGHHHDDDKRK
jgi:hypothetical protein